MTIPKPDKFFQYSNGIQYRTIWLWDTNSHSKSGLVQFLEGHSLYLLLNHETGDGSGALFTMLIKGKLQFLQNFKHKNALKETFELIFLFKIYHCKSGLISNNKNY